MYRYYAEDGDDDRQYQRETEQLDQQGSANKTAPCQRAGHRNGEPETEQGGEQCLPQTEAQHMTQIRICEQGAGCQRTGLPQQGRERPEG